MRSGSIFGNKIFKLNIKILYSICMTQPVSGDPERSSLFVFISYSQINTAKYNSIKKESSERPISIGKNPSLKDILILISYEYCQLWLPVALL